MKNALAITVGTTALAMTAATSAEYCAWSMISCDSPNSAEMVPKVRQVDMSSVVYIPSLKGAANILVTGKTPVILAATFTSSITRNAPGAASSADTEPTAPHRM